MYNKFYELINKSRVTLIGYTFKDEKLKDELISPISYIDIGEVNSSFSIKSIIRDIKLDRILGFENRKITHILFDTNNISTDIKLNGIDRYTKQKQIFEYLKQVSVDENFNIILVSSLNKNIVGNKTTFIGGQTGLYISDVAITLDNSKINLIKNRFGSQELDW
jgi:hypothetical protein